MPSLSLVCSFPARVTFVFLSFEKKAWAFGNIFLSDFKVCLARNTFGAWKKAAREKRRSACPACPSPSFVLSITLGDPASHGSIPLPPYRLLAGGGSELCLIVQSGSCMIHFRSGKAKYPEPTRGRSHTFDLVGLDRGRAPPTMTQPGLLRGDPSSRTTATKEEQSWDYSP